MQVKIHGVAKHAQSECRSLEEEEKKKSIDTSARPNEYFFFWEVQSIHRRIRISKPLALIIKGS